MNARSRGHVARLCRCKVVVRRERHFGSRVSDVGGIVPPAKYEFRGSLFDCEDDPGQCHDADLGFVGIRRSIWPSQRLQEGRNSPWTTGK